MKAFSMLMVLGLVGGAAALAKASGPGGTAEDLIVDTTLISISQLANSGQMTAASAALAAFTGSTAGDAKLFEALGKGDPKAVNQVRSLLRTRVRGMTQTECNAMALASDARGNPQLGNAWRQVAASK